MPVTMSTADNVLKNVYLDIVSEQLNVKTDPLYNKIEKSTRDISGRQVVKLAPWGVNGGIGAGSESGALPSAAGNNYVQFVSNTKNLYGVISITDKAVQASRNDAGAFTNILTAEMNGLLKAAKFNHSRMLYTDGTGNLATCSAMGSAGVTIPVSSTNYLIEGLTIDIYQSGGTERAFTRRITGVDRTNGNIVISGADIQTEATDFITIQGSYNQEITGLSGIFKSSGSLYGVSRSSNYFMVPYMQGSIGIISDKTIQKAIDNVEEISGGEIDYINCASGVRRSYQEYLEATRRNVNTLDLEGGFKAISYSGIPMVTSRFMPSGTMDLYDTSQFTMHQMSDWRWLEDENGKVLKQVTGYPYFNATLVKYCELICDKPGGQARLSGITEDDGIA